MRLVRWYSLVLVLGVTVFIGQFLLLGLPLLVSFVRDAVAKIAAGPGTVGFWDAVVLLLLAVAHFGTLSVVAARAPAGPTPRARPVCRGGGAPCRVGRVWGGPTRPGDV